MLEKRMDGLLLSYLRTRRRYCGGDLDLRSGERDRSFLSPRRLRGGDLDLDLERLRVGDLDLDLDRERLRR